MRALSPCGGAAVPLKAAIFTAQLPPYHALAATYIYSVLKACRQEEADTKKRRNLNVPPPCIRGNAAHAAIIYFSSPSVSEESVEYTSIFLSSVVSTLIRAFLY